MANVFVTLAKQHGFEPFITLAEFDKAAKVAKEIEPRMDAILSRGGVTGYIERAVKIPVVGIPITPFDVTIAINSVKNIAGEIAFLIFSKNYMEFQILRKSSVKKSMSIHF
jgi:hypothetical protein